MQRDVFQIWNVIKCVILNLSIALVLQSENFVLLTFSSFFSNNLLLYFLSYALSAKIKFQKLGRIFEGSCKAN